MAALAAGAGAGAVAIARARPELALIGEPATLALLLAVAGWALVAAGLLDRARHPGRPFGLLLAATGMGWLLADWSTPAAGSAAAFTLGLLLAGAFPALLGHALLAYPAPAPAAAARALAAAGYVAGLLLLGLLPALFVDPAGEGCADCPANLVELRGDGGTALALTRAGLLAGAAVAVAVACVLLWRLARATAARRRAWAPVQVPGATALALVAAQYAHAVDRGFLGTGGLDRTLRVTLAATLVVLAAGAAWERVRALRTRTALARLVVELGASPPPGGLEEALARSFDDPGLRLYHAVGDGFIDGAGRAATPPAGATRLLAGDRVVAALAHRPGLFDDPAVVRSLAATVRLALEHERLQAGVRAQLDALRASRMRIVEAGDAERRRLERDLHDGAQQRLVALTLNLRLAQRRQPGAGAELAAVEGDVRAAVAELRELAHGIHPSVLSDQGLAAALEALAEGVPRLALGELPAERFDAAVETAAYVAVTEALRQGEPGRVAVSARRADGRLALELDSERPLDGSLLDLEDRIGALGGSLAIDAGRLLVELPCAS